jgi:hypothetical protein
LLTALRNRSATKKIYPPPQPIVACRPHRGLARAVHQLHIGTAIPRRKKHVNVNRKISLEFNQYLCPKSGHMTVTSSDASDVSLSNLRYQMPATRRRRISHRASTNLRGRAASRSASAQAPPPPRALWSLCEPTVYPTDKPQRPLQRALPRLPRPASFKPNSLSNRVQASMSSMVSAASPSFACGHRLRCNARAGGQCEQRKVACIQLHAPNLGVWAPSELCAARVSFT